ncbi:MAG: glycosyltransferase family 9 protein, partial [Selenomonadaceae bacterium]|nr:glycosyltransferase family 9 protein [Selenomonadaceae bacterium]
MLKKFVTDDQIQNVIDGLNKIYDQMKIKNKFSALEIKNFMESYFEKSGYREKNKSSKNNNILVIHDSGIGDFITISAFLRELRRIYPKSHIDLLVNKKAVPLAETCPYIDNLIVIDLYLGKFDEFFEFYQYVMDVVRDLLHRKIDIAFNLGQHPGSNLLAYMSGAKERINNGAHSDHNEFINLGKIPFDYFSELMTTEIDTTDLKNPHYSELYICILKNYAKTRINNRELEIWFSPNDRFLAEINLQRFDNKKIYAISLGGGFKNKHWKAENFAKLINMILKNESATFAIFGGPSEIADAEIIKSIVDEQFIIDFTGKFNYRQSMALLNLCDCYIGNDTGLMHAATALKIPVLTPNCFANDIEMTPASSLQRYHPYKVPSVVVRPK